MNAIVKTVLIAAILTAIGALVNQFIPQTFSASINQSMIYFLSAMKPMDFLIPIDTVYACIQILGNFLFGIAGFYVVRWFVHLFANA